MNEVLFVAESSSGVLHPLNLGVERFTGGIRNLMLQVSDVGAWNDSMSFISSWLSHRFLPAVRIDTQSLVVIYHEPPSGQKKQISLTLDFRHAELNVIHAGTLSA